MPAILAVLHSGPLLAQAPSVRVAADTVPAADRVRIVADLDALVRRKFAHWAGVPGLAGARYDSLSAAFRAQAAATADRRAFGLEVMAFMGALQNGHTDFADSWLSRRDGAPLPFGLRVIEGKWVVTSSRTPELRAGDVIAAVDGEPFEHFFQRQRRYVPTSSERQARIAFPSRTYLFPAAFTLALEGGREVGIRREWPASAASDAGGAALVRAPHRWLAEDSVAYLRVPRFSDPAYQTDALAAIRRYQRAPALVLDLRNNSGGATPLRFSKSLTGTWAGFRSDPDLLPLNVFMRAGKPVAKALTRAPRYRGELFVLIDGGCISACEDLVVALRGRPNVVLVGDTTYGSSGQPVFLDFGNGMRARVSARRAIMPDGQPFEGVGLAPDVYVTPTPVTIAAGEDPVLARALALARAAITPTALGTSATRTH